MWLGGLLGGWCEGSISCEFSEKHGCLVAKLCEIKPYYVCNENEQCGSLGDLTDALLR
jgi:hypothetical protein